MGIGDPLSLFARYWINQTHRGTSFIHTLSPLNMTARPWLYKVCLSYCFGAKQCFWSGYMIYLTQGVLGTDFSSVFSVMGRHGQPDPAYQDKQHPLRNKQSSFFLTPLLFLKRAMSETSDFCLVLPISCPVCDRVWYNHRVWCKGLMSSKKKQTSL